MRFQVGQVVVLCAMALGKGGTATVAAQSAPAPSPLAQACGVETTEFKMSPGGGNASTQPPAGKALVYFVELMPPEAGLTTHVKLGMDGRWLAQLSARTFVSFTADPGVHHLCARYEGKAAASQIDPTILRRLELEAGKTYYLLYRGFITRDSGQIGSLDLVDEDEGRYVVQEADPLRAAVKR